MLEAILLTIFFLLLLAAITAWLVSRRMRTEAGLPLRSQVIYSDTGGWERVEKPLFSRRYQLTGKPDYIVRDGEARIPIEVKPNRVAAEPRVGDALQLMAYGMLIREEWGTAPSYGLLKYRDRVFRIEFAEELEGHLVETLDEMRRDLQAADVSRSHADPRRCQACGYREECGQAISDE